MENGQEVKKSSNLLWCGGGCLALILLPVILFLATAGLVAILYMVPLLAGLLIAYIIYWHTKFKNKKTVAIVILVLAVLINLLWVAVIGSSNSDNDESNKNEVKNIASDIDQQNTGQNSYDEDFTKPVEEVIPTADTPAEPEKKKITYSVYENWIPGGDGVGARIIIREENQNVDDLVILCDQMHEYYKDQKFVYIFGHRDERSAQLQSEMDFEGENGVHVSKNFIYSYQKNSSTGYNECVVYIDGVDAGISKSIEY